MDKIREFLKKTSSLLEEVYKELTISRGTNQRPQDMALGLYRRPSGIKVPFKQHRFVAEHYDLLLLRSYVQLFKKALNSENESFIGFSFRVFQELGIKKIDIFFSGQLNEIEIKKAKLIITMLDFILLGGDYTRQFMALYAEENNQLDNEGKKIFSAAYQSYSNGNTELPSDLLKDIGKYRTRTLNNYGAKVKQESFLDKDKMKKLTSFWSELLHGSPLMIEQIISDKFHWSTRLRAVLLITSRNVLLRTRARVESKAIQMMVDGALSESESIWKLMLSNWQPSTNRK